MWYYEFNHQPVGPVSQEAIAELLATGKINALTLVWQEGMPDWKHLGETALAALSRTAVPMAPTPIAAAPRTRRRRRDRRARPTGGQIRH